MASLWRPILISISNIVKNGLKTCTLTPKMYCRILPPSWKMVTKKLTMVTATRDMMVWLEAIILRSLKRCRFFLFFHCHCIYQTCQIPPLFMIRRLCSPAYSNSANREQCTCDQSQGGEGHVRDRTCHDGAGSFIIETGRRAIVPGAVRRLSAAAVGSKAPSVTFVMLGARISALATLFCLDS